MMSTQPDSIGRSSGFGRPDVAVAERWKQEAKCAESRSAQPAPSKPALPPRGAKPVIQQASRDRYQMDQSRLYQATSCQGRKRPTPPALDLRLLQFGLKLAYFWYNRIRSFVLFHRSGFVRPAVRIQRLAHCAGCSFRKDRGDGIMCCEVRQASCGCPRTILTGIWWLSYQWNFKCLLGHFDEGTGESKKAAGECAGCTEPDNETSSGA